MNPDKANV